MTNYYFLATLLPQLEIGIPPDLDYLELSSLLKINLTDADYKKVETIRRYFDIQNLRSFWREEPLNFRGNLNENELEEALLTQSGLPGYVFDFEERFEKIPDRLHHFASLITSYFNEEIQNSDGFVLKYLRFERDLRLVLTGLRAKKIKSDILIELQYEDPEDPLVAQMIAQKDSNEYIPPEEYEEVKVLFNEFSDHPLELHKALSEYRFNKIDQLAGLGMFSIDCILAYMIKLAIVEKWLELDKQKGIQILDKIVKESS